MINHTPQLPDTSGIPPAKLPKLHLDDTDHAYTVQSVSHGRHAVKYAGQMS